MQVLSKLRKVRKALIQRDLDGPTSTWLHQPGCSIIRLRHKTFFSGLCTILVRIQHKRCGTPSVKPQCPIIIHGSHFLKLALNQILTLPESLVLLIYSGFIVLNAFCFKLFRFFVRKKISVPISYISSWNQCLFSHS